MAEKVGEFLSGARRMMAALAQMDESKVTEVEKRLEALKASVASETAALAELRSKIKAESYAHDLRIRDELSAHARFIVAKRKEGNDQIRAHQAEVAQVRSESAAAKAAFERELAKSKEEHDKTLDGMRKEYDYLLRALDALKLRIRNA